VLGRRSERADHLWSAPSLSPAVAHSGPSAVWRPRGLSCRPHPGETLHLPNGFALDRCAGGRFHAVLDHACFPAGPTTNTTPGDIHADRRHPELICALLVGGAIEARTKQGGTRGGTLHGGDATAPIVRLFSEVAADGEAVGAEVGRLWAGFARGTGTTTGLSLGTTEVPAAAGSALGASGEHALRPAPFSPAPVAHGTGLVLGAAERFRLIISREGYATEGKSTKGAQRGTTGADGAG
jgi:hypothetical protein